MNDKPTAPQRRLFPAGVSNVRVADDFWAPKLRQLRTVTLNDVLDKFEHDGALANFDRVAQGLRGGHRGAPWFDGLIYETIRAASDFLAAGADAALAARLDGVIARIAAAQAVDPDGYLNTFVTLMRPDSRWGARGSDQLWTHEEYDAGCLVEAGVHHFKATGQTSLLGLAVRFANTLCAYMGPAPKHNVVPSHSLPEEAFIKLYQLLRDEPELAQRLSVGDPGQYLELVRFWMEQRGNHTGRLSFSEYAQDHRSLFDQPEAVGHAVRGTLLYAGLAALAAETGEAKYFETSRRLWADVVERKMFITGGVGPIKEYEGFGYGYFLPDTGYIETCAAAGLALWASQMNQAFGSAETMDSYERAAYNTVLAGVSLAGTCYAYENPLHSSGALHRWDWHGCPCCPPMLLKLFSEMPGLIYAHDGQDVYVNLYIGSQADIRLPDGLVQLSLQTRYPWDGAVRLTLERALGRAQGLRLRLPGWCQSWQVRVNGEPQTMEIEAGYLVLRRQWQTGDVIDVILDMPVQRVVSHPFVGASRERVALQRGPVVYCLEGVDQPATLTDPVLPVMPQFHSEYRPDLLGGVVVVQTTGVDGQPLTAIPYFAWDNRTADNQAQDWLRVWLKQENWFETRRPLDEADRKGWEHALYRPLGAEG